MRETYEIGPGRTVTVTIEASDATGERLYTAREVGDLQASEAELVAAPLRRELNRRTEERDEREAARAAQELRANQAERELVQERHRRARDLEVVEGQRDAYADRIRELERLLAREVNRAERAEEKVRAYDQDRHTERDRANENKAWAERAELRVAQMAQEKREAIERMADQLGKVIGAVHGYEVSQALQRTHYESAWEYQTMANAIRNVRRVVGSPTPPATPAGPEAQALGPETEPGRSRGGPARKGST